MQNTDYLKSGFDVSENELNGSYFDLAKKNLNAVLQEKNQLSIF